MAYNTNWGLTNLSVLKNSFKWTIHNLSIFCSVEETIRSPQYSTFEGFQFHFELVIEEGESIGLFLCKDSCVNEELLILCSFTMINPDGKLIERGLKNPVKCKMINPELGWEKFITKKKLLEANDMITIVCELSIIRETVNFSSIPLQKPKKKLINDLTNMLETRMFSDVTIKVGGNEFKAHKAVLACRSVVFAAMLKHNFEESTTNIIHVTDIDDEVFEEMLTFIYTGKSDNVEKMASKLFIAADKYALDDLKAICVSTLISKLTVETAPEYLILADLHNHVELKSLAFRFLTDNSFDVSKTVGWKNLVKSYPNLLEEAYQELLKLSFGENADDEIIKSEENGKENVM